MAEAIPPRRKKRPPTRSLLNQEPTQNMEAEFESGEEVTERRKRRRQRPIFPPPPEDLARIPLVVSSSRQIDMIPGTRSYLPQPDESDVEDSHEPVVVLSQDPPLSFPFLPVTLDSSDSETGGHLEAATPRQSGDNGGPVVDLTNDSGVEDEEDVVDLTSPTQINMPRIVPEHVFLHERPSCEFAPPAPHTGSRHTLAHRRTTVIQEVVSIPESDDEIQLVTSPAQSHSRRPRKNSPRVPPPYLPPSKTSHPPPSLPPPRPPSTKSTLTCPICMDTAQQFESSGRQLVTTVCGHIFCNTCIRNAIQRQHKCPTCRKKLTLKQYHPLFL